MNESLFPGSRPQGRESLEPLWRSADLLPTDAIGALAAKAAEQHPNAPMVFWSKDHQVDISLGELWRQVLAAAAGLQTLGLAKGDRIAIQTPNCVEEVVLLLAAAHLGLVVIPIVIIYGPTELAFILRQAQVAAIVLPGAFKHGDMAARVAGLEGISSLKQIITIGGPGLNDSRITIFDDLIGGAKRPAAVPHVTPKDRFAIVYTSGTTGGDPKGAIHTHETFGADVIAGAKAWLPSGPNKASLVCFPPGHVSGLEMTLIPILYGTGAVFMERWAADVAASLIEAHHLTWMFGAPFHLTTLLQDATPGQLATLQLFGCGGAGVPPALVARANQMGITATRAYGSTEHPSVSTGTQESSLYVRAFTDGMPMAGIHIRIDDDDGRECALGEVGEVVTIGPELFIGYLDSSYNETAFTPEGWYRSGDLGYLDENGALTIVDRKKDIIIRGGENISSKEVEDIIRQLGDVADVAVVGWPDDLYGERVGAFIQLVCGASLTLDRLQEHFAAAGVARQKTPERLRFVSEFRRTAAGKIIKTVLRDAAKVADGAVAL